MIKAILIATKKQRTLYRSGGSLCSFMPPISGLPPPRLPRVRRWICSSHATDVFRYMFYAADDDIFYLNLTEVQSSRPAKWVGAVFPEGQTEFFTKGLTKFELASSVPRFRTSCTVPNFLSKNSEFASLTGLTLMLGTKGLRGSPCGQLLSSRDIEDANRRWNEGYKDIKPVEREDNCGKRVRFPKYSPVTRIHRLITYGTALRLVREDRTWEFCCMDRMREGRSVEDEPEEEEANETSAAAAVAAYSEERRSDNGSKSEEKHLFENASIPLTLETIGSHANNGMGISRKKSPRKPRGVCNKGDQVTPSENVPSCTESDLLQTASSSSFRLSPPYFKNLSSFLLKEVCSPSSSKPNTSSRVVDEFLL